MNFYPVHDILTFMAQTADKAFQYEPAETVQPQLLGATYSKMQIFREKLSPSGLSQFG